MNRYQELIRPAWIEVDLEAIRHNLREIRRLVGPQTTIMAVVKAEAYGHGAIPVAKTAIAAGAGWLGVAMPEEGIALRKAGITVPILVFGPLQADQAEAMVHFDLTGTACWQEAVTALAREADRVGKTARVHVKVDTGMGRIGVKVNEVQEFLTAINRLPHLKVDGIYSHLATADEHDKEYAELQIRKFTEVVRELKTQNLLPEKVHLANSAGVIDLPESYFNMVRPGIILYGLYPSEEVNRSRINLRPALSLKARVTFVKQVPPGTGISYGQRYHTVKGTTIATIPIGYADGWSRRLSQKAQILLNGKLFPVVGTICMDQCMADLSNEPVAPGQEVVLIGNQCGAEITADMVAKKLETINYEVTCMLSERLPRVYLHEDA